jgi:outer membrane protein TolC
MYILICIQLSFVYNNVFATELGVLTLDRAINMAIENDPWLLGSQYREDAMLAKSSASATLPDPVVSIGFANVPTDGFAFDQEPMTQLKAGVSQMFPRGDSLQIRSKQLQQFAQQHPLMRQDRIAKSKVSVSLLWLEIYRTQQNINLIEQDRALFEQLSEIAQASYSSALGKVRQQDIVRAQLELSRLDDRLSKLHSQREKASVQLMEWFNPAENRLGSVGYNAIQVPTSLPNVVEPIAYILQIIGSHDQQYLANLISSHPYIQAIEQGISASKMGIELAKQQYKPQWGINASYAFRADDQMGRSRADFLSVGVSFDVPLFAENKQDKEVSAAINEAEALKTDKRLALRAMIAKLRAEYASYQRLIERQTLYANNILLQMREQAEASLTAYTNDDGDFAEVVRARIDDLSARIDALNIDVDLLKSFVQLNYYFTDVDADSHRSLGDIR